MIRMRVNLEAFAWVRKRSTASRMSSALKPWRSRSSRAMILSACARRLDQMTDLGPVGREKRQPGNGVSDANRGGIRLIDIQLDFVPLPAAALVNIEAGT